MYRWIMALTVLCITCAAYGATRSELADRIEDSERYFREKMEDSDTAIPKSVLQDAEAIMILRQYRAGFIFGGRVGRGIVIARVDGGSGWSAPAFVSTGEGSVGLQIGGQSVDWIFVFKDKDDLRMLSESGFKFGVDASAAIGPVGRDAEAKLGREVNTLAYSRSKGLYAGASIEGGIAYDDTEGNENFYGQENLDSDRILFENAVEVPAEADDLIDLLNRYSQ